MFSELYPWDISQHRGGSLNEVDVTASSPTGGGGFLDTVLLALDISPNQ